MFISEDNELFVLATVTALVALGSIALSPRVSTAGSFYKGHSPSGTAPGILSLTLSQVTTWIFARSIMNAVILGYFFGIGGAMAYAAYYLSFLTGAWIIQSLRFSHGFDSVQSFLSARFGGAGPICYNFVIGVRLLSEVFANLLVIGIIFGQTGTTSYYIVMIAVGLVTLGYAMLGGLHASIRTDVFQMSLFIIVLFALLAMVGIHGNFNFPDVLSSTPTLDNPGWVLLAVAFLQVWSYPMHDPVMMDRGFIADKRTTLHSFYHAAWLSIICILAFGFLGAYAGLNKLEGETLTTTLPRLLGTDTMLLFNMALIVSCMSTLDSTFSSAAKLGAVDLKATRPSVLNGRITMALFLAGGLLMVYWGSKDLFSAVAVSGTASMFLAPVIFFSLWMKKETVPTWSYIAAFLTAIAGAVLYFLESSGYVSLMQPITALFMEPGLQHKYSKLLVISALTLVLGCAYFALGLFLQKKVR
ncbi:MAG: sodium:proline symporter [Pseudomonadota bacterium]